MITFKQFLNEEDVQELDSFLLKHCRPLMSALDADLDEVKDQALYRGIDVSQASRITLEINGKPRNCYLMNVRSDREPLDTAKEIHVALDEIFEHEYGWKARSEAMFCVGKRGKSHVIDYGITCQVFPMGEFKFLWSEKISDLTFHALEGLQHAIQKEQGLKSMQPGQVYREINDMPHQKLVKTLSPLIVGMYDDMDLYGAINHRSPNEIMIKCKQYLAIPQRTG